MVQLNLNFTCVHGLVLLCYISGLSPTVTNVGVSFFTGYYNILIIGSGMDQIYA